MKWIKKGLVYAPDKKYWWRQHYAILPTPVLINEKILRIYFATTCKEKFGRITYIDVDPVNPSNILSLHNDFILDIGEIGAFDDCGVNVSSVINFNGLTLLYYAGYQRHYRSPYSILTGLAIEDGEKFKRYSSVPLLERTELELNLRSAPTIINDNNILKMWYVAGTGWKNIEGKIHNNRLLPTYQIKYGESTDGYKWNIKPEAVLQLNDDEFGFGRPYIFKNGNLYSLFYSVRSQSKSYRIGYAESVNGLDWNRKDESISIDISPNGWDSEMICYPAVIKVKNKTYLFYNGNNNGETGFGYAELEP